MFEQASNEELLNAWRAGQEPAAAVLLDRYFARLTALVRVRLSRKLARRVDPEDVVLSAWRSFFVAASSGRAEPDDGDDLWPLLATLTLRKLSRQAARHRAGRRSLDREDSKPLEALAEAAVDEPTPEDAIELADQVEVILRQLDGIEREVFILRMRGETTARIAEKLDCSNRTVRRAAERIRAILEIGTGACRPSAVEASERPGGSESLRPRPESVRDFNPAVVANDGIASATIDLSELALKEMIGEGGFGKVYRGAFLRTGATIAVKFLRKRLWSDRRAVESLVREAGVLRELSHRSIVTSLGWGRTPYGAVFLVMEHIDGIDLAEWVQRGQPSIPEIVDAVASIAEALESAHCRGIVHCDLKPSNAMRDNGGRIVLMDFGFARRLAGDVLPFHAGGTAGYLAPEQISDAFGTIGVRTDVYGIGALLYALLAGRPPFTGDDMPGILTRILFSTPSLPPSRFNQHVPPALNAIVLRCVEKESADRYSTAGEVASGLRTWRREAL